MAEWFDLTGYGLVGFLTMVVVALGGVGAVWSAALTWMRDNEFGRAGAALCATGVASIALSIVGTAVVLRQAPPPAAAAMAAGLPDELRAMARSQDELQVLVSGILQATAEAPGPAPLLEPAAGPPPVWADPGSPAGVVGAVSYRLPPDVPLLRFDRAAGPAAGG